MKRSEAPRKNDEERSLKKNKNQNRMDLQAQVIIR